MALKQFEPKKIYIQKASNITDMQWPCPVGFHVPTQDEWISFLNICTTLWAFSLSSTDYSIIKVPFGWYYNSDDGVLYNRNSRTAYWCSDESNANLAKWIWFVNTTQGAFESNSRKWWGRFIRPFKDTPVIPDSNWTVLYQWAGTAWIYNDSTNWLISVSSDGTTWITTSDKNLGATTVYNNWDTLSEANCWKYYQWWNNYWFPFTWPTTTSTTQVDASAYWPWNYYSSSTYIIINWSWWDSSWNNNLRWWESAPWWEKEVKKVYLWSTQVRPPEVKALCFTANTADSRILLVNNWNPTSVTLEYSTDGKNWSTYTIWGTVIILSSVWDKAYLRNTSTTTTGFSTNGSDYYYFYMTGSVSASWDVTYLINKNTSTTVSSWCFLNLFKDCTSLTTCPSIPATTINSYCYLQMFYWCTNLTTLPKLPATTLKRECYEYMFNWCTNIKLSTSQTGIYTTAYRIPTTWTGSFWTDSLYYMFWNTGWTFTWTPQGNTTYYTSNALVW